MHSPVYIGIDPDLHDTAIAVVDSFGQVIGLECATTPARLRADKAVVAMSAAILGVMKHHVSIYPNIAAVAIEGQTINFKMTRDPGSIIKLAHVTGCAVNAVAAARSPHVTHIYIPQPREWKGQVPKHIHHERICNRLGWECEIHGSKASRYGVPTNASVGAQLKTAQWKHALDAVGLASWVAGKQSREERVGRT